MCDFTTFTTFVHEHNIYHTNTQFSYTEDKDTLSISQISTLTEAS